MSIDGILLMLFVLALDVLCSGANIWNWALSQPFDQSAYQARRNHPRNIHQTLRQNVPEGAAPIFMQCVSDRTCGRGRFCDRHYGTCDLHRREGQPCRRDGHCTKNTDCMYGRCVKTILVGQAGSRCKQDGDCGQNMCCARRHGESVCKARLSQGDKCYVPRGGLDYSLNEICPCEEGLLCRMPGVGPQERHTEDSGYEWTAYRRMQCAPP
ncbi:dickkopf-related protein 3-like [Lineus longissimus]|uniref:dickkopf-related protein 3-like n=1 Tax=Lineus longissimus TaxID=88925 RepID=UPI002B4E0A92